MLGFVLSRPVRPVARRAKRGELLILLDERDHALAGGVVQRPRNASSQIASWPRPPQAKADGEYSSSAAASAASLAMKTPTLPMSTALALVGRLPAAPANTCVAARASDKPAQKETSSQSTNCNS